MLRRGSTYQRINSVLGLLLASALLAKAQQGVNVDDLLKSAEQWATNNLDENSLRLLQNVDRDQANKLFADLQRQFQGEYVVNLAYLKNSARAVLPLLENREETLPYALWLKTRLDYLEVADEFRLVVPPSKTTPGQPPPPVPNPKPQAEREAWTKKLAQRPWPPAARQYVAELKPVFTAERVPPELVWIAEVESSFDPRARSPVGATGMFQLMPATAKRFGLQLTPVDERLDPKDAARASAQYLRFLQTKFKDWRLALAAYNAGEGTVQGLLERHKAKTFDAIATRLPAETQLYVPKIEAVLLRRENVRLSQLRTL